MSNPAITSLEQTAKSWMRSVELLTGVKVRISPAQAGELTQLAMQLADLYDQEAAIHDKVAALWQNIQATDSSKPDC